MQLVWKYLISLILTYKVRKNADLLFCTSNQTEIVHKLQFRPKNPARAKLAAINNQNGCGTGEVWWRQFGSISYNWYYHVRSVKRHLCSVVPPTKLAQTISSIFSLKIQLGPNCSSDLSKQTLHRCGLKMELMACSDLVGGTTEQSCIFPDLIC